MTNTNDSETKGPERLFVDGGDLKRRPFEGYRAYDFILSQCPVVEYVRADLYTQSQRELEQAKQELAEVKRELGFYLNLSQYIENCHVEASQERDRYRELCEEALSVFDSGPIQFSLENVETIAKLRDVVNPPTPKPSDAQASESDDAVTREGG